MIHDPTRIVLATIVVLALAFAWRLGGRWRARVSDRLLYGVPWGTLLVSLVVVGFYLLAQGGLWEWNSPVVFPFVSWSYFYPTGLLTAGIAHGSPGHLLSNMAGTVAFAPLVEYAWGHYPPAAWGDRLGGLGGRLDAVRGGRLSRPRTRIAAFVVALLAGSVLISVFALGPGIGFSGVVFALAGFAVVTLPLAAAVGVVAASAIRQLFAAASQPILRAGTEAGPPAPPSWANIAFQAHVLGFLLGVAVAVGLLATRDRRPSAERVFFGTVLLGLGQSLWLIVWPGGDDTFVLYRAVGVGFVLVLSVLVTVAAGGRDRPLPRPLARFDRAPTRRQLATGWLALLAVAVVVGIGGAATTDDPALVAVSLVVAATLLALPAVPPLVPDRWIGPMTRPRAAAAAVVLLATLLALVAIPFGLVVVDDDTVSGAEPVAVGEYRIAYVDNATTGHALPGDVDADELRQEVSGVVVVSDEREIWTVAVRKDVLAYRGTASVRVGGLGWRETVDVEREGWDVTGNDSAYVVDLTVDGDRTRSFTSRPVRADARIDDYTVAVVPTDDSFRLRVGRNGTLVATTRIPSVGETAAAGPLEFSTARERGDVRVLATSGDTQVRVATREAY